VGQSDRVPVYVVQPQDGLDAIARNVFDAFVTYQEIAAANNIPDPNKIYVGQRLWIPLPCSCDQVGGADVMHFAYSVLGGDSTSAIAAKYGVSENTLLTLNKITDPKSLKKGQILDVPLPVCHSSISDSSADHGLLIPNGTYAFTAKDCIQCSCSANTYQLDCTPAGGGNRSCPAAPTCDGLKLGETKGTGCGSQMCAYTGYSDAASLRIDASLVANQTACQKGGAERLPFAGSRWTVSVICFHVALMLVWFL
jgi:chitin elicitor-binding protein